MGYFQSLGVDMSSVLYAGTIRQTQDGAVTSTTQTPCICPSGNVWARTATGTLYARRPLVGEKPCDASQASQCPNETFTRRVSVGPGLTEVQTYSGGRWSRVSIEKSRERIACESVQPPMPAAVVDLCVTKYNMRPTELWKECVATGMPLELVPACLEKSLAGQRPISGAFASMQVHEELTAQQAAAEQEAMATQAATKKKMIIYGVLAVGGAAGLYWYFRRRRAA